LTSSSTFSTPGAFPLIRSLSTTSTRWLRRFPVPIVDYVQDRWYDLGLFFCLERPCLPYNLNM
jgi:hypothetical protein